MPCQQIRNGQNLPGGETAEMANMAPIDTTTRLSFVNHRPFNQFAFFWNSYKAISVIGQCRVGWESSRYKQIVSNLKYKKLYVFASLVSQSLCGKFRRKRQASYLWLPKLHIHHLYTKELEPLRCSIFEAHCSSFLIVFRQYLNLVRFPQLASKFTCIFGYHVSNSTCPDFFVEDFSFTHTRDSSRDKHLLQYHNDPFCRKIITSFNALPYNIRSASKLSTFKRLIHSHLQH